MSAKTLRRGSKGRKQYKKLRKSVHKHAKRWEALTARFARNPSANLKREIDRELTKYQRAHKKKPEGY